jgi:hypothetical protein
MTVLKSYRGISYETAKAKLQMWLDCEDAIATGQSYTIGSRSLTRANLKDVHDAIAYWSSIVTKCECGRNGPRIQRAIPQDF